MICECQVIGEKVIFLLSISDNPHMYKTNYNLQFQGTKAVKSFLMLYFYFS